jgi:hypothetical protein
MTLDTLYRRESLLVGIPELLTAKGVGAILGISVKTVHKFVREKKLACVRVTSRGRRFTHEQIQDCDRYPRYFQGPRVRNGAPARLRASSLFGRCSHE